MSGSVDWRGVVVVSYGCFGVQLKNKFVAFGIHNLLGQVEVRQLVYGYH